MCRPGKYVSAGEYVSAVTDPSGLRGVGFGCVRTRPPMATAPYVSSSAPTREVRFRFGSRAALQAGIDRARREPWIATLRVDRFRRELVVELAGGFGARPPLIVIDGGADR